MKRNDAEDKEESLRQLRELMLEMCIPSRCHELTVRKGILGRRIVCTPFDGQYGRAGWVVAVDGTPPRGVLVLFDIETHWSPELYFFIYLHRFRRVSGERQTEVIARFIRDWLAGKTEAFSFRDEDEPK